MTQNALAFAAKLTEAGQCVVLVTVTDTYDSSPACVGKTMAVAADGTTAGTVGGGASEYHVTQRALQALANGERFFTFAIDHAEDGMVCGGGMSGIGNVYGNEAHLMIFGGGHVSQSLAPLAVMAGFNVTIVEDRGDLAASFTGVTFVTATQDEYEAKVRVPSECYAVVCTRGHKGDREALQYCLTKDMKYVGMIGSTKKVASTYALLQEAGVTAEALASVYAPIGLDIAYDAPVEIAISILSEVILVKNNGTARHRKHK